MVAVKSTFVKIWGEEIGAVAWDEENQLASFEFSPKFKKLKWDLAPLKMPIQSANSIYTFKELRIV